MAVTFENLQYFVESPKVKRYIFKEICNYLNLKLKKELNLLKYLSTMYSSALETKVLKRRNFSFFKMSLEYLGLEFLLL